MSLRSTLLVLLTVISSLASAAEITVSDAWVREAPPGASAIAAYMVVDNPGTDEQVLTGVSSPVSDNIQMHNMSYTDGVARMEQQLSIAIPAGGQLVFEPGGYHLMIMDPKPLKAGETVPFILELQDGSTIRMEAEVRRVMGADPHQHHHHH